MNGNAPDQSFGDVPSPQGHEDQYQRASDQNDDQKNILIDEPSRTLDLVLPNVGGVQAHQQQHTHIVQRGLVRQLERLHGRLDVAIDRQRDYH
jgi:hypothetical protein